jgi:hypothetical protein
MLSSFSSSLSNLRTSLLGGLGLDSTTTLLAGLGVTAATMGLGTAYLLFVRRASYHSFTLHASYPTVPSSVLFNFLVEPANYYDPRLAGRSASPPHVTERETGRITYTLDEKLVGLYHFTTSVSSRFYDHPEGRDLGEGAGDRHPSSRVLILDSCPLGVYVKVIWHFAPKHASEAQDADGSSGGGKSEEGEEEHKPGEDQHRPLQREKSEGGEADVGTELKLKVSLQGPWWKVKLLEANIKKEIDVKLAKLHLLTEQGLD